MPARLVDHETALTKADENGHFSSKLGTIEA